MSNRLTPVSLLTIALALAGCSKNAPVTDAAPSSDLGAIDLSEDLDATDLDGGGADSNADAGLDLIQPSTLPMGTGVTVLSSKTPCPSLAGRSFDCSIMDIRLDVRPNEPGNQGLELRLYLPNQPPAAIAAPAMFLLPGTGHCGTRKPISELGEDPDDPGVAKTLIAAEEGIVMVEFALRGHQACYEPGDLLYKSSTWIGPEEVRDAEEVLSRLLGGNIHAAIAPVDGAKLGLSGGSHGGISSFVYAKHMRVAQPFAALVPSVGTPDLADTWGLSSIDPTETIATASSLGMLAVSGFSSQQVAYPGSILDALTAAWAGGDFSQLSSFFRFRSAYDEDGSLDTFASKVKAVFVRTGGRDCIVPNRTQFSFWDDLQAYAGRSDDRWMISLWPHSCQTVTSEFPTAQEMVTAGGYFPSWSSQARDATGALLAATFVQFLRQHLLGKANTELPGPVLAAPLVREGSACSGPFGCAGDFRALGSVSSSVSNTIELHLHANGTLAQAAAASFEMSVVDHQPQGVCTTLDTVKPCGKSWNAGNVLQFAQQLEQLRSGESFTLQLPQSLTWMGTASLEMTLRLQGAVAGGGIVALLWYKPPGAPSGHTGWLVSQGWQYLNKTDTNNLVTVTMPIDSRIMDLEAGGTLQLELTNLSSYVHYKPWVHPHPVPYTLSLVVDALHPALLRIPVSSTFSSLPVVDLSAFAL